MDNEALVSLGWNSTTVSSNTKSSRRCYHDHKPLCRVFDACCERLLLQEAPATSEQIMLKPPVDAQGAAVAIMAVLVAMAAAVRE